MNQSGLYRMSFEDYLADPCPVPSLSRSTIKDLITKCPAKAFNNHSRLNPDCERDTAKKFDVGTAAHDLFLGGEGAVMVFDYADWKKNEAKEAREAARSIGKTPLQQYQFIAAVIPRKCAVAFHHRDLWQGVFHVFNGIVFGIIIYHDHPDVFHAGIAYVVYR